MRNSNVEARNPKQVGDSNDLRKDFQQEETERTERDFFKNSVSLLSPVKSLMHSLQSNSRKPVLSFDHARLFRVSSFGFLFFFWSLFFTPASAFAHIQQGEAAGFLTGFIHPISGLDHVLAMVAVGLWGAQLGAPAIWVLPVAFPMVMAMGGMLGLMGVPVPGIEYGIAASAILLGVAVLFEVRASLFATALLVGVFAIFHGHAHGTELPPNQSALLYSMGFVIATGCLHALGIGIGVVHRWTWGQRLLRLAGGMVAIGGIFFMWKAFA
jgi:urease accessory protein